MPKQFIVRISGGLGNQLHCYAFGRALENSTGAKVYFDHRSGYYKERFGRQFLLNKFPNVKMNKMLGPRTVIGYYFLKVFLKIAVKSSTFLPDNLKLVHIEEGPFRFNKTLLSVRKTYFSYFIGYWASPYYYIGLEDTIRKELMPPKVGDRYTLSICKKIKNSISCSVHFRTYEEENESARSSLRNYYIQSLDLMSSLYPQVEFYVFSDNIFKARKLFYGLPYNLNYVSNPSGMGNLQSLMDFHLMYECLHSIIGDSTFSWWAAWLSDQKNKKVIYPKNLSPWGNDWVPEDWIGLEP
jgi:hypothetical protein